MDVALVGVGKIALDQHVPAIAHSADWTLAATVSRHGTVDGVDAYLDMASMFQAHPEIRVVSLCMPPVPRFSYAIEALNAGRHVMLEKPPGATLSECHALIEVAEAKGLSIYATWHSRQAAMVGATRDWLASRRLHKLHIEWKENVRVWHPGQEWIWEPGGTGIFDPGINALSIMTEILPTPVHLNAAELSFPENRQAPIAARLAFTHPEGAEVSADLDWRQEGEQLWRILLETDSGTACLSEGGHKLEIDGAVVEGGASGISAIQHEYRSLYANMNRLVKEGKSDVDLAPLRHVADAFMLGRRTIVEAFID